jgi:organic hydroperoxide reductase OsmC/OhrA
LNDKIFEMKDHHYRVLLEWTGNIGEGTKHYTSYERSHKVFVNQKPGIFCSADPSFRGDPTKYNPEELLIASLSGCHMLWYLHLCAAAGITVLDYKDHAEGTMEETENGGGYFTDVILHPEVIIEESTMIEKANSLHQKANELCFVSNSLNFPVHHQPVCKVKDA